MGKSYFFNYGIQMTPDLGQHPKPPPLPHYDPNEEAPKYDWYRILHHLPRIEKLPDQPKRPGDTATSDDKPDWRGVIKNNVIPLPDVEPYNFRVNRYSEYFYFETPDYADPFKKLWYAFKWFVWSGALTMSVLGIVQGRKCTFKDHKYLLSTFVFPWVYGGMVAATSAITIANLRGNKDDLLNYVGAGLVAGAATGRRTYHHHFRHTVFWVSAATLSKYNAEINGHLSFRISPLYHSWGMSGMSSQDGIKTGNFNWFGRPSGDPGRDSKGLNLG